MSTRTGTFPVEGKQPEGSAPGRFSQELDICETIGRTGDFSGKYFYEGMNSNVHYWFDPADGSERQDIRAEESKAQPSRWKKFLRMTLILTDAGGTTKVLQHSI